MTEPKQSMRIESLIVEVKNPTKSFVKHLNHCIETSELMYFDRFIYGIPEMFLPASDSTILINLIPSPDLLDPWTVMQDIKYTLEDEDRKGGFKDE